VCASAVVVLDTPCSEVVWRVLATHSIRQFPLHFPYRASLCAITFQLDSNTLCNAVTSDDLVVLTVYLHNNTMMLLVSNVLETAPVSTMSDTCANCAYTHLRRIVSLSESWMFCRQWEDLALVNKTSTLLHSNYEIFQRFLRCVYISNGLPCHSANTRTHSKVENAEVQYSMNNKCACLRLGISIIFYHRATWGCLSNVCQVHRTLLRTSQIHRQTLFHDFPQW
jgi:hypothetical protein